MATVTEEDLTSLYDHIERVAVVGCSTSEDKAAHKIPRYLQEQGYTVVCVNPGAERILDAPTVARLEEVPGPVDAVVVFRPSEEAPGIAEAAVAAGASVLWLQEGITSEEARRIAEDAGLTVIEDRCIAKEHGRLGLGPGPGG